jgi:hypothetical protein
MQKIEFGNVSVDCNKVSERVVGTVLCTLHYLDVSFELQEKDTELHVVYKAKFNEKRVVNALVMKVLPYIIIDNEYSVHEVIQYYGCEMSQIVEWDKTDEGVFEKRYIYRVPSHSVMKVADSLEEWNLLVGRPYEQGHIVKGYSENGKVERLKLALT